MSLDYSFEVTQFMPRSAFFISFVQLFNCSKTKENYFVNSQNYRFLPIFLTEIAPLGEKTCNCSLKSLFEKIVLSVNKNISFQNFNRKNRSFSKKALIFPTSFKRFSILVFLCWFLKDLFFISLNDQNCSFIVRFSNFSKLSFVQNNDVHF